MAKDADVAPAIGSPFLNHWYCNVPSPAATTTLSVNGRPSRIVAEDGWKVILGTATTLRIAVSLNKPPGFNGFEMRTEYDPASVNSAAENVRVAAVAPATGVPFFN